jgi:hypothetical protein
VVGSLRLGEIVFHGEALGCSHPDAAAKRPVAVLFDEQDEFKQCMQFWGQKINFKFDGAYSGGRCIALKADANVHPEWQPPIGHFVPNWDFEIVETPPPGQYRYLQFAWKAVGKPGTEALGADALKDTKAISIGFGGQNMQTVCLHAGTPIKLGEGTLIQKQLANEPPTDWHVERVDLWALLKKPGKIQSVAFGTSGGGALVDQILLGRTEKDLADFSAAHPAAKAPAPQAK